MTSTRNVRKPRESSGPKHTKVERAIERDEFPFERLSEIAEVESWRKEIFRPIYHVHKWWAQRLGSVFRAVVLAAGSPVRNDVMRAFYEPIDLDGLVVFDPFMGSGTTVGEAAKLGCIAIGRDINPVAVNAVRVGLGALGRTEVEDAFRLLEKRVGDRLRRMYQSRDAAGELCDVLYFFWVKRLSCPECSSPVDLFSRYVFAKHAYAKKYPTAQVVCPGCGEVFPCLHDARAATCARCRLEFDPQVGPARNTTAICGACNNEFPIAKTVRASGKPPEHRLYAKLILTSRGEKRYLRATALDVDAYEKAGAELSDAPVIRPLGTLEAGHNTKQAIGYGYTKWEHFFNGRQLLALGILASAIDDLPAGAARDALAVVFSGVLEFNNMFASYKGEGTGAVRHMFSHHVLKPERMPIEANPWGLPQSSGAFSTLYRSRLLRALEYHEKPFEVGVERSGPRLKATKVFGSSKPLSTVQLHDWNEAPANPGVYLSCGDSSACGLAPASVDLVITDPPFFDNVHYSELADFFFAWQRALLGVPANLTSTRQVNEVQDRSAEAFGRKLGAVFTECHRVLRPGGMLIFSYHHSRDEGWYSLATAICDAGFSAVQAHPVKAEMSVAAPKTQAAEPIDVDVILVCRKFSDDGRSRRSRTEALKAAHRVAGDQIGRLTTVGKKLSRNDVKVILFSRLLVETCAGRSAEAVIEEFQALLPLLPSAITELHSGQRVADVNAAEPQLRLAL